NGSTAPGRYCSAVNENERSLSIWAGAWPVNVQVASTWNFGWMSGQKVQRFGRTATANARKDSRCACTLQALSFQRLLHTIADRIRQLAKNSCDAAATS